MSNFSDAGAKFSKKLPEPLTKAFENFANAFLGAQVLPLRIVGTSLFLIASISLFAMIFFTKERERSVFFFPAATDFAAATEIRYLNVFKDRDPLYTYISEYLLGSSEPDRAAPFASSCTIKRCFIRGNTAYIDLSPSDSLAMTADPEFAYRCLLLEKNICTNFKNIDTIFLYLDGIEVYSKNR